MDQMTEDLQRDMARKLRRLITDTAEVCEIGGLSQQDIVCLVLSVLLGELANAATILKVSPVKFIQMCLIAHAEMKEVNK